LCAETVGPHRQLRADAHDQQDRRVGGIAEVFIEDLDSLAADRRPASRLHSHCLHASPSARLLNAFVE
jgi:hypothetical protein